MCVSIILSIIACLSNVFGGVYGMQPMGNEVTNNAGICSDPTNYRLSDCIHLARHHNATLIDSCTRAFPDSLCVFFLTRKEFYVDTHRQSKRDYSEWGRISKSFCNAASDFASRCDIKPFEDNSTIVVHLRLGDVIADNNESVQTLWESPQTHFAGVNSSWNYYVRTKHYFEAIISQIPSNIKAIHLIGNIFHGNLKTGSADTPSQQREVHIDIAKNLLYVSKVQQLFLQHRFEVITTLTQKSSAQSQVTEYIVVDTDFISMMQAFHFVPTGGGYSQLIAQCNKQGNFGTVYLSSVK